MANTKQARKRAHQNTARNAHNTSLRSRVRTAVKAVRKAIAAGDKNAAQEVFRRASGVMDSVAGKKVIHKNTAARKKSRLAAALKAMH